MPRMYLFNQSSASPPRRGLVPTDQTTKNQRSRILLFHMAPEKLSENQICAQPSASRGGPESDPPSRLSGRAARAWQRARSSSHHRSDWAELTVSMGSRNTMSDRESSCRNTRRGPGPGFGYGFSLDPESTSQRAIADEGSQAAVCHSRLLNSDPKPKKHLPFALSATSCDVLLSAQHNLHPHRTAKSRKNYAYRKRELSAVPHSSKRTRQSMNVGKELQTKVAPPCTKHAKPGKSEYPKRILGKSGVNRMCDSVHKKSRL